MSGEPTAKTDLARSAAKPATKKATRRRSSGIGVPIARSRFLAIAVAVFVGLGLAWWAATGLEWVKPIFLPSPGSVATQIAKLAADGTLWLDLRASMYRISIGFLLASALSIPIGVLIGSFRSWEAAIEPLVDFIRYMPVVAFVPLSILWAGTGDTQKFLIIFIGTFFQQVLMIMDNVKRVPADFIGLGRTLGLPDRKILTRIVVPSALPGIWDTLRISLGWAWTWLVLAELVAATSGLGYRITVSQRYFQTNTIIGYILLLGVLGLITDQVMKALEKVLFRQDGHSQ
ncbi:ABC transporter permease [Mesorhizobium sp. M8A.F.Ca.ET.208.01.1.1]|uniref:ABC transporter permease n=2 Tax=Mesorhizobium TaxID=68287 RepID=UPI0010934599|nr:MULTISPECIES: ABC transporter permease [unclassified Mesorhizobium]TGQ90977.1 ABC transporter permease [Mesorhizobium sp. M8A.F.Ca.ET.208.01.1.1]TGT51319.1 ABC transporter permease [Mesorhizobium sp. M8A.F.Ca.ET.167.01.1.1]